MRALVVWILSCWLVLGACEVNVTSTPEPEPQASLQNKTKVWSQPDLSAFNAPVESSAGFSASQVSDAAYTQTDQRSVRPFFPSDFTRDKGAQDKQKPIKFEDDVGDTRFAPEHVTKGYGLPPSHPYPYQFVNSFASAEGGLEPAPTATVHHPVSLHDGYHSGKKTVHKGGHMKDLWEKVVRLFAAFIPLGLFLVALPPNVLTINSTSPHTIGRQRAYEGDSYAAMSLFERFELDSLDKAECESRLFCEIAHLGASPGANILQQGFWQVANDTPDNMADAIGLKQIFTAIREGKCEVFKCPERKKKIPNIKEKVKVKSESE